MYNTPLCLGEDVLFHPRFRRRLTGYEKTDLLYVCFLAQQGKDPAFIPAAKMDDVRLRLDIKEDVWARRLAKWEAQGLVRHSADGLDITLLWTDDEDDEAAVLPAAPPVDADAARRASQRERQRASRDRKRTQGAEARPAVTSRTPRPGMEAVTENVTLSGASVTPEKRDVSQIVTVPVTSPYVDVDVKEEEIAKQSSESGDVNVTSTSPVTPNVTAGERDTPQNVPETVTPQKRNVPSESEVTTLRKLAVAEALRLTGDSPTWTPRWSRIWSHCQQHDRLDIWAEACTVFVEHQAAERIPPNVGPGQWLQGILLQKLFEASCPLPSGTAGERADVQRQIRESLQASSAASSPPAQAPAAPSEPVTLEPVALDPDVVDKAVRSITRALGDERRAERIAALVDLALSHGHASMPDNVLKLALDARKSGTAHDIDGAWFCTMMTRSLTARKVPLPPELCGDVPPAAPEPGGEDAE